MYEYVKKSEYAPIRKELEEIIRRTQIEMRKNYGLTFQFHLIGSGKRHLITRIVGGNNGYDFDYNLILSPPGNGYRYNAKIIKQYFITALKTALRGSKYSFPNDSTSSITIKVIDKDKKKICYRCDFAEKVHDIIKGEGWAYIKEEYLLLKNINEGNRKHSFSLYAEAVNNVYNQMFLQ